MTSKSFSRFAKTRLCFSFLGLILRPELGDLGQLLQKDNPWQGFIAINGGPVLVSLRGEKIDSLTSGQTPDCARWVEALEGSTEGERVAAGSSPEAWKSWSPWLKNELKLSAKCDNSSPT
jgi:hypothetical protein